MDKDKVIERINYHISAIAGIDETELVPTQNLREDLDFDSLDEVDLVIRLEHEFHISISDDDILHIKTIQDVFNTIDVCMK